MEVACPFLAAQVRRELSLCLRDLTFLQDDHQKAQENIKLHSPERPNIYGRYCRYLHFWSLSHGPWPWGTKDLTNMELPALIPGTARRAGQHEATTATVPPTTSDAAVEATHRLCCDLICFFEV